MLDCHDARLLRAEVKERQKALEVAIEERESAFAERNWANERWEEQRAEAERLKAAYENARRDFLRCAETQRAAFRDAAKAEAEVVRLTRENERLATGRTIEGDGVTDVDLLRAEVERVEVEAAAYRRVLVAVRDAMKATGQEPDGDDDPRRPLASLVWRVLREKDAGAGLLAEVERLRAERDTARAIASANGHADLVVQRDRACAEVERLRMEKRDMERERGEVNEAWRVVLAEIERLRGLIAEVEWVSGGYIMGPPSCPWCSYPVKEDGHSPDCPAFSARGEVRR